MKLLIASHLYPSCISRTAGSFVHNQARFLQPYCQLEAVAPIPWFPLPGLGHWSGYRRIPREELRDGVRVLHPRYPVLPGRILYSSAWRPYLAALERAAPYWPDVVHAHCAYVDGLAAAEYAHRRGCPLVLTVHGNDIKHLPEEHPRIRARVTEALERAAAVIAVSQELAGRAAELGASPARLHVIPNGVDCQAFACAGHRQPGVPTWRLMYVGRFAEAKGIGVLLEAFARLRSRGRNVELELVGGASATGTAGRFIRHAEALGIGDRVSFADEVPWTELPARLGRADIFVLPSYSEGLPLVLLEAMACGLPIVSTRCGGPEEIVNDRVGVLVDVGDPDQLASGMAFAMDGYDRFDRRAIRQQAEERFDYRIIAARIWQTYQEVLGCA